MKKRNLFIALLMLWSVFTVSAQQDSFHIQIQDTLLKAGNTYTLHLAFRESIADIDGFQFCIGYDNVNLQFKSPINTFYIPGMDGNAVNENLVSIIPVAFYSFEGPYQGRAILDVNFQVLNDCRVKNVLSILPAFRYTQSGSYFYSEIYKPAGTYPIATEYLPFKNVANKKSLDQVSSSFSPNPLSSRSTLQFDLPLGGKSNLEIFNVNGNKVKSIPVNLNTGKNSIMIDKDQDLIAGMYTYQLQIAGSTISGKFQVL